MQAGWARKAAADSISIDGEPDYTAGSLCLRTAQDKIPCIDCLYDDPVVRSRVEAIMAVNKQNGIIPDLRQSAGIRYSFCIVIIALSTLIQWFFNPILGGELPYLAAYFGIMLIAWKAGFGPAVAGVILNALTIDYFIMAPLHSLKIAGMPNVARTALFALIGVAAGAMGEAYHRAVAASKAAYRLSERQQVELEQIYSSAPIGLAFLDENLRYLRVNQALASFNGVPAEAHVGRHISEVLSPATTKQLVPLLAHVLSSREPVTDIELQGSDVIYNRETRYVRVSFYPVQVGELKGIHAVVEDVTAEKRIQSELKAIEEQLRHTVKMEAIGRLAGGVAHDFNNLLMVISSYTELLLQQHEGEPESAKKLRAISGATQRAARLTRQLLAFSRKQTLKPEVIDIDSSIRDFEQLLQRVMIENIDLVLELDSNHARIKADASQLEQVLMNLAVNARDAMPAGGRFAIHTRACTFEQDTVRSLFSIPKGEYVEISISDTGRGMSPEVQVRIFDPFFTTKEPGQGTGLGLAMSYGIIKQSGGYIEVNSAVGQGTTFRIWLPTTAEACGDVTVLASTSPRGRGTILIVEDEAELRRTIGESLSALGYRILEAQHGDEALEVVERHSGSIDLLLSDIVMPQLGGVDLIQRMRANYPGIKLILMSGNSQPKSLSPDSEESGEREGNVLFLQKPFAHSELAQAIAKLLSYSPVA
jgi:two-component system, cell cycle sensor histidine kinase and response regulator CckA